MKNGDELSGKVEVSEFSIITTYGQVVIPSTYIRTYQPEGAGQQVAMVESVDGDVFSGFLVQPAVKFRLSTGNELSLRKESIDIIEFGLAGTDTASQPSPWSVTMRNGDIFDAEVSSGILQLETSYGELDIDISNIQSVDFEGEGNVLAVVTLRNGDTARGQLRTEVIDFRLTWGEEISVFNEKLAVLTHNAHATLEIDSSEEPAGTPVLPVPRLTVGNVPVSDQYVVVVRKKGGGQVSSALTLSINGESVGVFLNDDVVDISSHLKKGVNLVRLSVDKIQGAVGKEDLVLRIGPALDGSFSPQWLVDTSMLPSGDVNLIESHYFALDREDKAKVGDVALFAVPAHAELPLPLVSDIHLNGEFVARVTGTIHGLPLNNLVPNSIQELDVTTNLVPWSGVENDTTIEVGEVTSVQNGRYKYRPITKVRSSEGWTYRSQAYEPSGLGNGNVDLSLPFTY